MPVGRPRVHFTIQKSDLISALVEAIVNQNELAEQIVRRLIRKTGMSIDWSVITQKVQEVKDVSLSESSQRRSKVADLSQSSSRRGRA